jgi:hypothetical protein
MPPSFRIDDNPPITYSTQCVKVLCAFGVNKKTPLDDAVEGSDDLLF